MILKKMGLKKLFEGSDSENDDVSKISNIEVDEQYAKRYEHNKKREALERLHELEKKGLIQSSSDSSISESDDDDFINSSKRDREFGPSSVTNDGTLQQSYSPKTIPFESILQHLTSQKH
ncbi:hypothetical protein CMV_026657, partial [Castanea mollissima]